jgi:hypothetical protein
MMKRNLLPLLFALVVGVAAHGQLPQFSSASFEDWVYTNPAVELNRDNILNNKIYLYTTSERLPLTLISPLFTCRGGYILDMDVTWVTDQWMSEEFVVRKVGLTATILDAQGAPVDSVTFTPSSVSRTNHINLAIAVPDGMTRMKLRFASWKADINSNGAVRQIAMTTSLIGDVNLDGEITVADANLISAVILGANQDAAIEARADVNRDGEVGIADVNRVIDLILN